MMKQLRFTAMAILALALGFSSCSKEDGIEPDTKTGGLRVAINFPASEKTVTKNPTATADEQNVQTVQIFVFSKSGNTLLQCGTSEDGYTGGHGKTVVAGEADGGASYWTLPEVKTGLGDHIIVTANLTGAQFDALATAYAGGYNSKAIVDFEGAFLDGELPMASDYGPIDVVAVEDPNADPNDEIPHATVTLRRMTAKVTMKEGEGMTQEVKVDDNGNAIGYTAVDASKNATTLYAGPTYEYNVNQFNTKSYVLVQDNLNDPNYTEAEYKAEDFIGFQYNDLADNTDDELDIAGAAWVKLDAATTEGPDKATSKIYLTENTSEGKSYKEIYYMTVRSKFYPAAKYVAVKDDGSDTPLSNDSIKKAMDANQKLIFSPIELDVDDAANAFTQVDNNLALLGDADPSNDENVVLTDYYTVTPSSTSGTFYFTDTLQAQAFVKCQERFEVTLKEANIVTYENCFNYWITEFNPDGVDNKGEPGKVVNDKSIRIFDVFRNAIYRTTVSKVIFPGSSRPDGGVDPDGKPDEETTIYIKIDIAPWEFLDDQEVELGN